MEDYFGGSWSFAAQQNGKTVEQNYNSLYLGYPFYSKHDVIQNQYYNDDCPPMRGFYRWHIPDPIFFDENLKVTVQQIGVCSSGLFERQDDLSSVAYWCQLEPHNTFPHMLDVEERWPRKKLVWNIWELIKEGLSDGRRPGHISRSSSAFRIISLCFSEAAFIDHSSCVFGSLPLQARPPLQPLLSED